MYKKIVLLLCFLIAISCSSPNNPDSGNQDNNVNIGNGGDSGNGGNTGDGGSSGGIDVPWTDIE